LQNNGHVTRYSDSSLYDEVCTICGATDAMGDTRLDRPCPASPIKKYYYVMRTHSHTDLQQLWKVMTRRIADKHDAEFERDFAKKECKNPKHEFFLIEKWEEV
jgi:hypothetical protein